MKNAFDGVINKADMTEERKEGRKGRKEGRKKGGEGSNKYLISVKAVFRARKLSGIKKDKEVQFSTGAIFNVLSPK